jgi:hypothetical protein
LLAASTPGAGEGETARERVAIRGRCEHEVARQRACQSVGGDLTAAAGGDFAEVEVFEGQIADYLGDFG